MLDIKKKIKLDYGESLILVVGLCHYIEASAYVGMIKITNKPQYKLAII